MVLLQYVLRRTEKGNIVFKGNCYVVCFWHAKCILWAMGSSFWFCESCISILVILLGSFWIICLGSGFVMVISGLSFLHVKLVSSRSCMNSSM